jgi:hypothetical protein
MHQILLKGAEKEMMKPIPTSQQGVVMQALSAALLEAFSSSIPMVTIAAEPMIIVPRHSITKKFG